ncbi:hypothetical protein M758_6G009900 [Ceratodon purpureus]|nr:hypothetical protein M758_6G009900 [Ceratodon purpureus]
MAKMAMTVVLLVVCTMAVYVNGFDSPSGFPVPSYYVMGDAFHDAGNNNFIKTKVPMANYKPYGMTYFKKPNGRFSDGRIFSDLLAVIMKLPQAAPSLSNVTIDQKGTCINFASGGSAILPASSVAMGAPNAFTFDQQVTQYEGFAVDVIYEYGVDQALLILNDAIYQLNLGTIDLLAYFTKPNYAATAGPLNTFLDSLAAEYLRMVERLYSQGARKVVVFGIGPISKTPLGRFLSSKMIPDAGIKWCAAIDSAVRQLNGKLSNMVKRLNADSGLDQMHASLQLVYADVYGAVTDITRNPTKYGFTDVKNACCGGGKFGAEFLCGHSKSKTCRSVSKNLFWNGMQFTEAGNKKLFSLFFGGSSFVKPFSVQRLCKLLIPGVPY